MEQQREVIFWLFVGFFFIIGILSLLTVVGILKTDPRFRRWAVTGFVTGVAGAVFALFKIIMFGGEVPLYVALLPPPGQETADVDLVRGHYSSHGSKGWSDVELTLEGGGWRARLPQNVLDKAVELRFEDRKGKWWGTRPFSPNYNRQSLVPVQPPKEPAVDQSFEGLWLKHAYASTPKQVAAWAEDSLKFNNYARSIGELHGRTYYQWRVFLDEPRSALDKIAEVQYLLHPTFPEPFQFSRNPSNKFALETKGWGEFKILIRILYKDGTMQETSYSLNLSKGWPGIE